MQTKFTAEQLRDPATRYAERILRSCVHCGFCIATCPTYQLLGDELDSPRGRIYLIKDMLETGRPADAETVKHIDRCLGCLACMTTCPSGVNYKHLIDQARAYIETSYKRPLGERILLWLLAQILPYPTRFRLAILCAWVSRPVNFLLPKSFKTLVNFAPNSLPPPSQRDDPQVFPAQGHCIKRVALMTGCAQKALNTDINDATIRLLTRHGCEVLIAKGMGCCGALAHHMGKTRQSRAFAKQNIQSWMSEINGRGLDSIVINTSGCGTSIKDYGHMFRGHSLARDASIVAALANDISELMLELGLKNPKAPSLNIAYHAACSLQHGQQIKTAPKTLLSQAGFRILEPQDAHLCCGSAGIYNLMQPELSGQLRDRKIKSLSALKPDAIAAGNIGCMMQIGADVAVPILHTAELLDWATGGPKPPSLRNVECKMP